MAGLPVSTPLTSCRSRHTFREHGVEARAQRLRHPPAIHRNDDAAPVPGGKEHLRTQIGPGSVKVQMGDRAGRRTSALVHLMALTLVG